MFSHLPSLNHLRAFEAAARFKSFKKAAEELHVTPTAVSHQIKSLEELLGTLLFERKTRAVALTKEGELLAATAFSIFKELEYTINEITHTKDTLTVSTTSSFAALWLVPNLEKFYQQHPDIDISIKAGEQIDDVEQDRRIDMAIRYGVYDSNNPQATQLVTESIGLYATPDYLSKLKKLSDARIFETRWDKQSIPPVTWKALTAKKEELRNVGDLTIRHFCQEHYVIQAALAGQGIALVSSLLVRSALDNQWLVSYEDEAMNTTFDGLSYYLVMPQRSRANRSAQVFSQWLSAELS